MFEEFNLHAPLTPPVPIDENQDVLPAYLPCPLEDREVQFRREEKLFADQMGAHAHTKIMEQLVKEGRGEKAQEDGEGERIERQIDAIKANTASLKSQLAEMKCKDRHAARGAKFQGPC